MEARAVARHIRISPRKARQVIDLIRGKDVDDVWAILRFTPKAGSPLIEKIVRSAVANAENNYDMDADSLYVAECYVDQGPTLKRIRPRARGMADRIRKRTSHITVILREKEV
ncbi:MAG: 50S ribosomal protein L22 [Firmicutes bacterium]|nr:50S ribosomal protein L22 [Bacillota bacterium]